MTSQTDTSLDALIDTSTANAASMITNAEKNRSRREIANRKRFARLFRDDKAIDVTMALTDEVMRISSRKSAAKVLRSAAKDASIDGFGFFNAFGLRFIALASYVAPSFVVAVVHGRVRGLSKDLILAAEPKKLKGHSQVRKSEGINLNINVLGEAVLGDREASERLSRVLEMMRRENVNYVSVKLSAVVSQITPIDYDGSLQRMCERLRVIYREAKASNVFVNLDMEEFRDLRLTVDVFKKVLSEPEFTSLKAGIVLQAYLPDSHGAFDELLDWSKQRYAEHGSSIKIRLVKGANLAMEHAEAQMHGWVAAPFDSKADVDASYSRLLDISLRPENADAVRIGVASHNLFHVTWALEIARTRGVLDQIDIEMLEGMANAEALAIVKSGQPVLFYAPVTQHDDFAAAVAYLVRRLDENTSDENYLKAAFYIAEDQAVFEEQKVRFKTSVEKRHTLDTNSRRLVTPHMPPSDAFENISDGDPTFPGYVEPVLAAIGKIKTTHLDQIPLVINGEEILTDETELGHDPSNNASVWYRYSIANADQVDAAVSGARRATSSWSALSTLERRRILENVSEIMQQERAASIAIMAKDAGKTVSEADPEVSEAIDFARYYADTANHFADSSPLGVVLVVPPWNFPYAIANGGICAALAAGNTVIFKPAPETVATGWALVQQLWRGGVPKDVLQFVPTRDDENGRHLVTHEGIDAVILTGAFATAEMFTAWKPDINLLAETSGKNSLLISSHADIDLAVKDLVQSAFGHAGQKCSAASLAIVEKSIFDNPAFTRQLIDAVESLKVGPGYELSSTVGPIIRTAEANLARAFTTLDDGELWLIKPEKLDDAGLLWHPGVKLGVKPGSWSHQNEWFGPVLGVMVAPDFETALRWQNSVPYGLTAGLHSLDESECQDWIDRVEAGNVYLNRSITGAVVDRQPFGGWKRSSVGPTHKAGGANYVNALRSWPVLHTHESATASFKTWWYEVGSRAIDKSNLSVEANIQRYRHTLRSILVRVDDSFTGAERLFLEALCSLSGAKVLFSCAKALSHIPTATIETIEELVARAEAFSKVRWLSTDAAPVRELLEVGISTDRRPLAQDGHVEGPRWFLEQSVAMTRHRYGNINAGPKPVARGLGD